MSARSPCGNGARTSIILRAASRIVVFRMDELMAEGAAALALVEPVSQQDESVPVVVQTAYVVRQFCRFDGQPHLSGPHIQARDLVPSQCPLFFAVSSCG